MEIVPTFSFEGTFLNILLDRHLLVEVFQQVLFLLLLRQNFLDDLLVCLLRAKVSLVELSIEKLLKPLLLSVILYLSCKLLQVLDVVLHSHLLVVSCDNVLLLLAPIELFSLVLSYLLNSVDLLVESIVSRFLDLISIVDVLRSFALSMVVHLEWSMRPEETRVKVGLILVRNVLSLQCKTNQLFGTQVLLASTLLAVHLLVHRLATGNLLIKHSVGLNALSVLFLADEWYLEVLSCGILG